MRDFGTFACLFLVLWIGVHAVREPTIRGKRNLKVLTSDGSEKLNLHATTRTRFLGPQSFSVSTLDNSYSVVFITEALSKKAYSTCDIGSADLTGKVVIVIDENFECLSLDRVYDAFTSRGAAGLITVTALRIPGQEYYRHDFGPGKMVSRLGGEGAMPFLSVSKYDEKWMTFVGDSLDGSDCPEAGTSSILRQCSDDIQLLLAPGENPWRAMYESWEFILLKRGVIPLLYFMLGCTHLVFNYAARKRQEAASVKGVSVEVGNWLIQGFSLILLSVTMAAGCAGMDEFFRWRHSEVYNESLKGAFSFMVYAHFTSSRRKRKGTQIFPVEFDPRSARTSNTFYRGVVLIFMIDIQAFATKYVLRLDPSTTTIITTGISVFYTIIVSSMCMQILCWSVPAIGNNRAISKRSRGSLKWLDDKNLLDALTATFTMGYVMCLAYAQPQRDWTPTSYAITNTFMLMFRWAACSCSLMFLRITPNNVPDAFKKSEKYFNTNSVEGRDSSSANSEMRSSARDSNYLVHGWTGIDSSEDFTSFTDSEVTTQISTTRSGTHHAASGTHLNDYEYSDYERGYVRPEDALLVRRAVRPYPVSEYRERTDRLNEAIFASAELSTTGPCNLLVCLTDATTIFHLFGFSCANRVVAFIIYFEEDAARLPERIPDDIEVGHWETVISVERQPLLLEADDPNAPRRLWHACVFVDCLQGGWREEETHVLIEVLRSRTWLDTGLVPNRNAISERLAEGETEFVVGMELSAETKHVATVMGIAQALEREGFRTQDITACAQAARSMKTKLQQQSIRKAAEILATGMEAAYRATAIGSSELEIHSEHTMAMMRAGGEILPGPPTSVSINSGGMAGIRVSRRRVEGGDFVHVRTSGIFVGERVSCSRVFFVRPYTSFVDLAPKEVSSRSPPRPSLVRTRLPLR